MDERLARAEGARYREPTAAAEHDRPLGGKEAAMTSPHEDPKPGTREHFLQLTALRRWGTIQEYVDLCQEQGYFTEAFYRKATAHMERIHVRRMLRQVTDGRGWPTLANIVRAGNDGRPERVFMQEELFGPEEYRQVVAYHYSMARHHLFKAQTYREHAKARYDLQLPLFDEEDGVVGDETGPFEIHLTGTSEGSGKTPSTTAAVW
jgi:hypothetical protein